MKIMGLLFFLGFISASDQAMNKTNAYKSIAHVKNLNKATSSDKDGMDARLKEYKIIMEYINDARKCSGYEN